MNNIEVNLFNIIYFFFFFFDIFIPEGEEEFELVTSPS
jgi:hypothetical protein